MQLKIRRSQREGGLVSKSAIFCIDARVEFTPEEKASVTRYKLQSQVIYNSEASKRHLDKAAAQNDGSFGGGLKSLASVALAAMKLNITIAGLERGQHIECKSLDELLGAEEAIMTACQNLKGYLDTALTFDGREVLVDFATGQPAVVAAATPHPQLAAPARAPAHEAQPLLAAPASQPEAAIEYETEIDEISAPVIDLGPWFEDLGSNSGKQLILVVAGLAATLVLLIVIAG